MKFTTAIVLLALAPNSEAIYLPCCETTDECAEYYNKTGSFDKNGTTYNACCYPNEEPTIVDLPECANALAKNEDGPGIALMTLTGGNETSIASGVVSTAQDAVAGVVNTTSNLIPDMNVTGAIDFIPTGGSDDACAKGTDCTSCLDTEGCSWSPDANACLSSCSMIADASCYDGASYNSSVCSTIVASTCGESTDCASCLSNDGCTWFQYDGYTGYCETGCGMNGCGASVCPTDITTCEDCLGGEGTPASGQYSWSPNANECLGGCNVIAYAACFEAKSATNPSGYDSSICNTTFATPVGPSAGTGATEAAVGTAATEIGTAAAVTAATEAADGTTATAETESEKEGDTEHDDEDGHDHDNEEDADLDLDALEGEDDEDSAAHVQIASMFGYIVSIGLIFGSF